MTKRQDRTASCPVCAQAIRVQHQSATLCPQYVQSFVVARDQRTLRPATKHEFWEFLDDSPPAYHQMLREALSVRNGPAKKSCSRLLSQAGTRRAGTLAGGSEERGASGWEYPKRKLQAEKKPEEANITPALWFTGTPPRAKMNPRAGSTAARGSSPVPAGAPAPDPFRIVAKLVTELRAIRRLPAGAAGGRTGQDRSFSWS
jgi:hypothetical protein